MREIVETYVSKFSDPFAAYLYNLDPDWETGDSSSGPGWFGVYGRHYLIEHPDGSVERGKIKREDREKRDDEIVEIYAPEVYSWDSEIWEWQANMDRWEKQFEGF